MHTITQNAGPSPFIAEEDKIKNAVTLKRKAGRRATHYEEKAAIPSKISDENCEKDPTESGCYFRLSKGNFSEIFTLLLLLLLILLLLLLLL